MSASSVSAELAVPRRAKGASDWRLAKNLAGAAATAGAIGAAAALTEAVVVPALVVGALVLAPRYFPGLWSRPKRALPPPRRAVAAPAAELMTGLNVKQALAKTVTYRVAVTGLDFGWNYMILGDAAVSAGLSAATLVLAPVFYFVHEAVWNKASYGAPVVRASLAKGPAVTVAPRGHFTIDRALAKTITFRAFASTMELATNYAVVRDLPTAAALSAFGFVFGPFLYFGHEKLWERLGPASPAKAAARPAQAGAG